MGQLSLLAVVLFLFTSSTSHGAATPYPMMPAAPYPITSYASIVKRAAPAVVSISTLQKIVVPNSLLGNDPFFNFFFGNDPQNPGQPQSKNLARSLGSGVIVDPAGIVITCAHVVENADKILIRLSDNREFEGEIIIKDKLNDLAAIRLKGVRPDSPLPTIALETKDIEVGDIILAIGNPFGVGQTVTNGIISAIARNVRGRMLIQTDASINPGNSGGALVSMDGNLIGIPNAILSRTGANHGIGFAIPDSPIQNLLTSVNNGGILLRPWAGIDVQGLTNDLATTLGMKTPQGVLVKSLHSASPTILAGLSQGDVITGINGRTISNPEDFFYRIQSVPAGQNVVLNVLRNMQALQISFLPVEPPAIPAPNQRRIPNANHFLGGLEVANLSPAMISKYQLPMGTPEKGVFITDIGNNVMALQLNLKPGDIVEKINKQGIENVDDLFNILPSLQNEGSVMIRRRDNSRIEVNKRP